MMRRARRTSRISDLCGSVSNCPPGAHGAFTHCSISPGDTLSDIEDGDASSSSDSDSDSSSEASDFDDHDSISGHSDLSLQLTDAGSVSGGLMADEEFRTEVTQSLERAFAEGHSVDNAAVELKTLRMASNVPLTRVKEAVIAAIVERIPLVDGDARAQRTAIGTMVGRWGALIDRIGGVDPVETVTILQVRTGDWRVLSAANPFFCRRTARHRRGCPYLVRSSLHYTKMTSSRRTTSARGTPCPKRNPRRVRMRCLIICASAG